MVEIDENFAQWACDSKRTLEERFGAQLLIEITNGPWKKKHGIANPINYQAEQLWKKERSLDPAYQPHYTRRDAERAEEMLPDLHELHQGYFEDRPLRDLSILRFCRPLHSLELRYSEILDWSLLRTQPGLKKVHITDTKARDLRPLGDLSLLETLTLIPRAPWPDLRGLEKLSSLRDLTYFGNILALNTIPHLASIRSAKIRHNANYKLPLREVGDLPDMPELRRLHLENTAELHGIERYSQLLNLEIYGYYTDLTPLASLRNLTHLILSGGEYPTVAPIACQPALRKVTLRIECPPDLTPLADAPRLHEIALEVSPVVPPELSTLNSLFNPWTEEFVATPPRSVGPLRLIVGDDEDRKNKVSAAMPRDWGDDHEMGLSEARWFVRRLNRRLTRLLGKGAGCPRERTNPHPGHVQLPVSRPADIDRLPEIAQAIRKLIASARHPWSCMLIIDSLAEYERDMDEIHDDDDDDEFDAEHERQEWECARKRERERKDFIARKYNYQLSLESGAPLPPPVSTNTPSQEDGDLAHATGDDDDEPEYDLGTRLHLYATITEKAVYILHPQDRALAEMLFEVKAES